MFQGCLGLGTSGDPQLRGQVPVPIGKSDRIMLPRCLKGMTTAEWSGEPETKQLAHLAVAKLKSGAKRTQEMPIYTKIVQPHKPIQALSKASSPPKTTCHSSPSLEPPCLPLIPASCSPVASGSC